MIDEWWRQQCECQAFATKPPVYENPKHGRVLADISGFVSEAEQGASLT